MISNAEPYLLIVEDDDVDFMFFERMAKKQGLNLAIHRATSAQDGLDFLLDVADSGSTPPLLTVLDLNTPGISGHDFLRAIRSDTRVAHSTVFVYSTSRAKSDVEMAYDCNVAGYVVKDIDSDDLKSFLQLLEDYTDIVVPHTSAATP